MSTNLTVQIISMFMVGLIFCFGRSRWHRFDLIDVYILMVGIFFGVYSLIDAYINDLKLFDSAVTALTLIWIIAVAVATWIFSHTLHEKYTRVLKLRYLILQWEHASTHIILLLLGAIIYLTVASFYQYGIISRINFFDMDRMRIILPYWYTSAKNFMQPGLFCVFIASFAKLISNKGKPRIFWSIVSLTSFFASATYGRRDALLLLFMSVILLNNYSKKNLFGKRSIMLFLTVIVLMFMISNIFQNYRNITNSPMAITEGGGVRTILRAALDTDATLSNLQIRMATWKFNYMIINKQVDNYSLVPYGKILWESIKNVVPKLFWPGKPIYDTDEDIAIQYKFLVTDYPSNNFGSAQADFGYLSIVFLPLQMMILFYLISLLILLTKERPTLCTLVTGFSLQYLLNIEQTFTDYFVLIRNITMIIVCYGLCFQILKLLKLKLVIGNAANLEDSGRY